MDLEIQKRRFIHVVGMIRASYDSLLVAIWILRFRHNNKLSVLNVKICLRRERRIQTLVIHLLGLCHRLS